MKSPNLYSFSIVFNLLLLTACSDGNVSSSGDLSNTSAGSISETSTQLAELVSQESQQSATGLDIAEAQNLVAIESSMIIPELGAATPISSPMIQSVQTDTGNANESIASESSPVDSNIIPIDQIEILESTESTEIFEQDISNVQNQNPSNISAPQAVLANSPEQILVQATDGMVNLSDRGIVDSRGLKAFPGAEGGGQNSSGGRGGKLIIVDSLECTQQKGDGIITWAEAISATGDVEPGPRMVVFEVGGFIDCGKNTNPRTQESSFLKTASDVYIACQTAPSPGIHIALYRLEVAGDENITMRGCQMFTHELSGNANRNSGALRVIGAGDSSNLIFDRMQYLHTVDDLILGYVNEVYTGTIDGVSLTNSIVAESDPYTGHPAGHPAVFNENRYQIAHGPQCSTKSTVTESRIFNCSLIGNAVIHLSRRALRLVGSSGEISGNMIYNIVEDGIMILQRDVPSYDVYFTDNVNYLGPNYKGGGGVANARVEYKDNGSGQVFSRRNKYVAMDGTEVSYEDHNGTPNFEPMTFHPPRKWRSLEDSECLGVKTEHKDLNIERIMSEVFSKTGEVGIETGGDPFKNDVNVERFYEVNPNYWGFGIHSSDYDSDRDGMQDDWERNNGLTVGEKDHNQDIDNDGYTNIEEFVNYLMRCR